MSEKSIAIVIVTWNVRDLVLDCLQSVYADFERTDARGEVWLVDNDSSDSTVAAVRKEYPLTRVLEPGDNLGFAAGNNYALRTMGFPDGSDLPAYVLLLNPDTVIQPGALQALLNGIELSGAGLAGARLLYGDGSFQHSAFAFPGLMQLIIDLFPVPGRLYDSRVNGRYSRSQYSGQEPFDIDHPLGATFLLKREVIQTTGMFDEEFYLYCEEIDWAMRIKAAGWRAVCVPTAAVVHYGGQSTSQVKPQSLLNLWTARLKLYRKHYGAFKRIIAGIIIRAGMNRQIQTIARDSSLSEAYRKEMVDSYREILKLSREM